MIRPPGRRRRRLVGAAGHVVLSPIPTHIAGGFSPGAAREILAQEGIQRVHISDHVTLITGAAADIGAELARVFASKHHRLARSIC
jgi:hypothetical protein